LQTEQQQDIIKNITDNFVKIEKENEKIQGLLGNTELIEPLFRGKVGVKLENPQLLTKIFERFDLIQTNKQEADTKLGIDRMIAEKKYSYYNQGYKTQSRMQFDNEIRELELQKEAQDVRGYLKENNSKELVISKFYNPYSDIPLLNSWYGGWKWNEKIYTTIVDKGIKKVIDFNNYRKYFNPVSDFKTAEKNFFEAKNEKEIVSTWKEYQVALMRVKASENYPYLKRGKKDLDIFFQGRNTAVFSDDLGKQGSNMIVSEIEKAEVVGRIRVFRENIVNKTIDNNVSIVKKEGTPGTYKLAIKANNKVEEFELTVPGEVSGI
jgi:hypothetical protein